MLDFFVIGIPTTLFVVFAFFYRRWLFPKWTEENNSVTVSADRTRRSIHSPDKLMEHPNEDESILTLFDLLKSSCTKYSQKNCMGERPIIKVHEEEKMEKHGDKEVAKKWTSFELGSYKWLTYGQVFEKVTIYGRALRKLGLNKGDTKFSIYLNSCPEWMIMAHGCWSQSLAFATVYANLGEEGLLHALKQTECEIIFSSDELLQIVLNLSDKFPLKTIIYKGKANNKILSQFEEKKIRMITLEEFEKIGLDSNEEIAPPSPSDLASIVYTSGSTGIPKGVLLVHRNFVSTISAAIDIIPGVSENDIYIAYLPLAHSLELVVENGVIAIGGALGYGNPRTLLDSQVKNCKGDLQELQPTLMAGVPAIWERVRKSGMDKLRKQSVPLKFMFWAAFHWKKIELLCGRKTPTLDKFIFSKFKEQIGGHVRILLSGGAPLSEEVHWFLRVCLCERVIQAYGLTETSGSGAFLPAFHMGVEIVGPPLPSVELKLIDVPEMNYFSKNEEGEIWIRGPAVSPGYFKNEKQTKESFLDGGWFATGDIGKWCSDGTLAVIDRKKNLVKLSHGEYIALESVESKLQNSEIVSNLMIYADPSRASPIAVVFPVKDKLVDWAKQNNVSGGYEAICKSEQAKTFVLEELKRVAGQMRMKYFEIPADVFLTPEEWTPENGMLTAAMKLNRNKIFQMHKQEIQSILKKLPQ